MRLKFLFFPIILVISLSLFIGYIWPDIGKIKKINEDGIVKKAQLQAISVKKSAIDSVESKIAENSEGETFVNSYLPVSKTEEKIINGINYLAGDANVSLVNMSLSSAKSTSTQEAAPDTSFAPINPMALAGPVGDPMGDPMMDQPAPVIANPVQMISASISVAGDYDKIRIFLDSLQRMPYLNTVNSVNIAKAGTTEGDESGLSADIAVDFGYLNVSKVNSGNFENFKADVDNGTVEALREYISKKSQTLDSSKANGKTNPFLIN